MTAKQSALQSPLRSHSCVLSAPPPTPRKPQITPTRYPRALALPDTFRSTFPSRKASRRVLPPPQSHTLPRPLIPSAFYLFADFPARPAPPPPSISPSSPRRDPRPRLQPPSDAGAGAVTLLSLKASFSSYTNPLYKSFSCSAASPKTTFN